MWREQRFNQVGDRPRDALSWEVRQAVCPNLLQVLAVDDDVVAVLGAPAQRVAAKLQRAHGAALAHQQLHVPVPSHTYPPWRRQPRPPPQALNRLSEAPLSHPHAPTLGRRLLWSTARLVPIRNCAVVRRRCSERCVRATGTVRAGRRTRRVLAGCPPGRSPPSTAAWPASPSARRESRTPGLAKRPPQNVARLNRRCSPLAAGAWVDVEWEGA